MSCYIVANTTIDEIVFHAIEFGIIDEASATITGQLLVNANTRSVNARYKQRNKPETYVYSPDDCVKSLYAAIACVNEFDYQACEARGWESSDMKTLLSRVVNNVQAHAAKINEQVNRYQF